MKGGSGCLDENQLAEFVEGRMTAGAGRDLESHVAGCTPCRELLAEIADVAPRLSQAAAALAGDRPLRHELRPVEADRYEVKRELARGGMGRILEAWDTANQRPVAIKVLLDGRASAAWRFVREARITARLQHPGIVPLYEAGRWQGGEPFFAMKLVTGRSLAHAVAETMSLDERLALLSHLVAVTDALAYAHGQHIIHRDLKPANVLLGAYGETVVVDWGLAKELGGRERPDVAADAADAGAPDETRAGHALGTPSYMPPEQARGVPADERADVYALGAMLYHLLSGVPPHAGASAGETIAQVLEGPPPRIAERVPRLPPDLVTIVEKAMARDAAARYPSAGEMAADLRRFANGQLVSAHAYTFPALVKRWVARRRAVVATAAILVSTLAVVSALGLRRIVEERDRAGVLKVLAEREGATAVTQRDAAERLVQFTIGELRDRLEPLGRLDALVGLGGEVEAYYRTLAPGDTALDIASLKRRGAALGVLFGVELKKQNYDVADALGRRGQEVYQRVLDTAPEDVEALTELALIQAGFASIAVKKGKLDDGLAAYRRAAATAAAAVRGSPGDPRARTMKGLADANLAFALSDRSDLPGARAEIAIARGDLEAVPVDALAPRWASRFASALCNIGNVEQRARELDTAARTLSACIDVRRQVARVQPMSGDYGFLLAVALRQLAFVENARGHVPASRDNLAAAVDVLHPLVAHEPENAEWARELATAAPFLCQAEGKLEHFEAAEAACREGIDRARQLVAAHPDDANALRDLVRALRHGGEMERGAGRPAGALPLLDEAHDLATRLLMREPKTRMWGSNLVDILYIRARAEMTMGHIVAASRDADEAVDVQRRRVESAPSDAQLTASLSEKLALRGDIARRRGDLAVAEQAYAESLSTAKRALAAAPGDSEIETDLARADVDLAEVLVSEGGREEARPLLKDAIERLQPMRARGELEAEREALLRRARLDATAGGSER